MNGVGLRLSLSSSSFNKAGWVIGEIERQKRERNALSARLELELQRSALRFSLCISKHLPSIPRIRSQPRPRTLRSLRRIQSTVSSNIDPKLELYTVAKEENDDSRLFLDPRKFLQQRLILFCTWREHPSVEVSRQSGRRNVRKASSASWNPSRRSSLPRFPVPMLEWAT
jgi:hypothetical protein